MSDLGASPPITSLLRPAARAAPAAVADDEGATVAASVSTPVTSAQSTGVSAVHALSIALDTSGADLPAQSMQALDPHRSPTTQGSHTLAHTASMSSSSGSSSAKERPTRQTRPTPHSRRQRYMRDDERLDAIRRIERGEKQSAVANDYGVTRSAICSMFKNREAIIRRTQQDSPPLPDATSMDTTMNIASPSSPPSSSGLENGFASGHWPDRTDDNNSVNPSSEHSDSTERSSSLRIGTNDSSVVAPSGWSSTGPSLVRSSSFPHCASSLNASSPASSGGLRRGTNWSAPTLSSLQVGRSRYVECTCA